MSTIQVTNNDGYAQLTFTDCHCPKETCFLEETPWLWAGKGKEEHVLYMRIRQDQLLLAQSDIRDLLPYFERFASTGKLLP